MSSLQHNDMNTLGDSNDRGLEKETVNNDIYKMEEMKQKEKASTACIVCVPRDSQCNHISVNLCMIVDCSQNFCSAEH